MPANVNSQSLPKRKPIRLHDFDYAEPNAYFVTICTRNRACLFGRIIDEVMHLNDFGRIASEMWKTIPAHFPNMVLDEWVVMPNHVHGIIFIVELSRRGIVSPQEPCTKLRATHASPLPRDSDRRIQRPPVGARHASPGTDADSHKLPKINAAPRNGSIGVAVGSYKSAVTKHIGDVFGESDGSIWQRGFYDHVIRNRTALDRIRRYIAENPARWSRDPENPDRNSKGRVLPGSW